MFLAPGGPFSSAVLELPRALKSGKATIGNLELHMPHSHAAERVRSCLPKHCPLSEAALNPVMDGTGEKNKTHQNSLWEQLEFVSFTLLPEGWKD